MKLLLQRVSRASVSVGGETVGAVGPGYMALVGCRSGDTPEDADRLAVRAAALRVFEDAEARATAPRSSRPATPSSPSASTTASAPICARSSAPVASPPGASARTCAWSS